MLDYIVNTRLLSHPMNWAVVFFFVLFWGVALAIVKEGMSSGCGCDNGVPD